MTEEIKTPRTDEAEFNIQTSIGSVEGRIGDAFAFARQLERELAQSTTELEQARENLIEAEGYYYAQLERAEATEAKNIKLAAQMVIMVDARDHFRNLATELDAENNRQSDIIERLSESIETAEARIKELESKLSESQRLHSICLQAAAADDAEIALFHARIKELEECLTAEVKELRDKAEALEWLIKYWNEYDPYAIPTGADDCPKILRQIVETTRKAHD